ncbi:MAG: RlmE family RNA methyltransferase [Desulfobacterales bacterium]|nr:RlmE family RNA methyltransferase [Desulfobacterales bacterium]
MKKKNKNKWEDHLSRKARAENYPARSVYKLEEIQNRFKIIRPGDRVLDLGCAPGSWLLYSGKKVGNKGTVLGIDLKSVDIRLPDHVRAIRKDIRDIEAELAFNEESRFNVILSDMAPDTTGRKDVDAARSYDLCCLALDIAEKYLLKGGHFVCKIFQGDDFSKFRENVKESFKESKNFRPNSCRKNSKEIYIIAKFMN